MVPRGYLSELRSCEDRSVAVGLTKRQCDAAEPRASEYTVWDSDPAGFGLRVWPSGRKAFVLKYRVAGRQRKLTLGQYGALTVDEARRLARVALADVTAGRDPAEAKHAGRGEPTMRELAERFEREHVDVHLKPKTARPYRRLLAERIVKTFGSRKLSSVTRADVAAWHHAMKKTPVEANRALMLLHKLFNMAAVYGWYDGPNPAAGVQKYREKARERYLNTAELYRIGKAIADLENVQSRPLSPHLALGFRLLLLTGMRRDEVLTLRWEYVDTAAGVIRLPDSKTGAKSIPLSAAAVELLKTAPRMIGSPYVVTADTRGADGDFRHVVNPAKGWQRVLARASSHEDGQPDVDVRDVRLHDCRHSVASVGVSAGLSLPVVGALLGHVDQASTARYAHLYPDALRQAADRIGAEIADAMNGAPLADVVELRDKRST